MVCLLGTANNRDHLTSHHCLEQLLRAWSQLCCLVGAPPHPRAQGALSSTWQGQWCSGHQPLLEHLNRWKKSMILIWGNIINYSWYQFKSVCYDATVTKSTIKKFYGLLKKVSPSIISGFSYLHILIHKNLSYLWLPWLWQSAGERTPFPARVLQLLEEEEKLKVCCLGLTRLRQKKENKDLNTSTFHE